MNKKEKILRRNCKSILCEKTRKERRHKSWQGPKKGERFVALNETRECMNGDKDNIGDDTHCDGATYVCGTVRTHG